MHIVNVTNDDFEEACLIEIMDFCQHYPPPACLLFITGNRYNSIAADSAWWHSIPSDYQAHLAWRAYCILHIPAFTIVVSAAVVHVSASHARDPWFKL